MENEILVKVELLDENDPDRFEILSFNAGVPKKEIPEIILRGDFFGCETVVLNMYILDNDYNEVECIY